MLGHHVALLGSKTVLHVAVSSLYLAGFVQGRSIAAKNCVMYWCGYFPGSLSSCVKVDARIHAVDVV